MGYVRQNTFQLNWSAALNANPFVPAQSVNLSGVNTGAMAGTNTIYSNVQTISEMHNIGLEITWTGTPTGTLSFLVSASGNNFYPYTPDPAFTQPAGSAGGSAVTILQVPFRYCAVQYVNSSGNGTLTIWIAQKDLG